MTNRPRMVPTGVIDGHRCAWHDCPESFRGDLPEGWCWLVSHTSPQPELDLAAVLDRIDLDIVLCAGHRMTLQQHFYRTETILRPKPAPRA